MLGDERVVEIRGELRDLPQVLGEDTQLVVVEGIDVDQEYYSDFDAFKDNWVSKNNYQSSATYNRSEEHI